MNNQTFSVCPLIKYSRRVISLSKGLLASRVLLFLTLITCCSPSAPLLAASHFVDNAASSGGNGSSWASAWNTFAAIDWGRVRPGDVVYISGGNGSKVYTQKIRVQTSGTASARVLITRGATSGHNGAVILDGKMQIDHGIHIDSRNYITVSDLQIRNFYDRGQVYVRYTTGVIIQRNEVYVTGHGGVFLEQNTNTIVRENRITTPQNMTKQTDGIYSQRNTNNIYESNIIIISNEAANEHNDGIQLFQDTGTTIRGNYIEQDTHKTFNAQGILLEASHGTLEVYNNIVYGPNTKNALLKLLNRGDGTARMLAHHNTLVGGGWGVLRVEDGPQSEVKNNILVSDKEGALILRLSGALPSPANIDANLYYLPRSSGYGWIEEQSQYGWSAWRDRGYERNGVRGDPGFVNISARDFSLTASSPALDAGIPLGSPYQTDTLGTARPQGQTWDIGAFEYTTLPTLPDTTPPDTTPPGPNSLTAVLENPQSLSHQSGIGLISGWVCEADRVEIEIDDTMVLQAGYGTDRGDTEEICGDTANGFGLLFNWNLLGDGMHTLRALADGEKFAQAVVTYSQPESSIS